MPSPSGSAPQQQQQPALQRSLLPVGAICEVVDERTGVPCLATVLSRRMGSSSNPSAGPNTDDDVQYYIHRHDQDTRMDGWVDHASVRPATARSSISSASKSASDHPTTPNKGANGSTVASDPGLPSVEKGKRKADHDLAHEGSDGSRTPSGSRQASPSLVDRGTEHRRRHKASAAASDTPVMRNIDRVLYGNFDIKTWYHSPYPLEEEDVTSSHSASHGGAGAAANKRHQSPLLLRHGPAGKGIARKGSSSGFGGALSTSSHDAPAVKTLTSTGADSPTASSRQSPSSISLGNARSKKDTIPTKMLWICDGCFKYMKTYNGFAAHRKICRNTHPPGRKVYQRGAHIIWQVDGAAEKLYCQNLSLFGKLFIDHKTIYFDVEPFMFYVLTDAANASFDHPLGFFSKEKVSYDDYNLACIVTFPPFQRKSFGTLMIEFSYYLSAAQGMLGTPERPLSDLGFKGYLSFWTAVLLRALICCFDGPLRPDSSSGNRQRRPSSAAKPTDDALANSFATCAKGKAEDAVRRWQILSQRCKLLNVSIESISHQDGFAELRQLVSEASSSESASSSANSAAISAKRRLRLKGWAGSLPNRSPRQIGNTTEAEASARRSTRVTNGSCSREKKLPLHPALNLSNLQQDGPCTMAVTVEALSQLTHLRPDDIVLALSEAGLATAPTTPYIPVQDEAVSHLVVPSDESDDKAGVERQEPKGKQHTAVKPPLALLLTSDAIREAISRFNVRPAVLDESYALI